MDIQDLTGQCGVRTIPGFAVRLYAVCACDIETFPPYKTSTAPGDKVTLNGSIVLKEGKKWATIDAISETGKLTETEVGVIGSQNFQSSFEHKLAKTKLSDEWMDQTPNACMVYVVEDKDGYKRVLGNERVPVTRTAAIGNNGPALADEKTWAVTIMDNTGRIAPYYEGAIDLTGEEEEEEVGGEGG
jgi:hypothetical protein